MIIALRYLKSKKKQGFISFMTLFSILGICIGVAALIVVMAVMEGFHTEISKKMIGWGGDITISDYYGNIVNYKELIDKSKSITQITEIYPVITSQVMLSHNNNNTGAIVKAMNYSDIINRSIISKNITSGNIENFQDYNIIIGSDLAENMNIKIGDEIDLISPSGNNTVIGFIPRIKTFKVIALFKSGMYQYDSSNVIIPLNTAQIYFKLQDSVSLIELSIKDPYKSNIMVNDLKNLLDFKYRIDDWQITNLSYFNILKTERFVMFLILTLIIIVASFNIVSSLIMLVRDKTKDIAILRTMGASKYSIIKIFIICGSLIGIIGTFLGVILGLGFALNIESIRIYLENITGNRIFDPVVYYLSQLPVDVRFENVITIISISISLSLAATIYPAYSASSINPADGTKL